MKSPLPTSPDVLWSIQGPYALVFPILTSLVSLQFSVGSFALVDPMNQDGVFELLVNPRGTMPVTFCIMPPRTPPAIRTTLCSGSAFGNLPLSVASAAPLLVDPPMHDSHPLISAHTESPAAVSPFAVSPASEAG